MPTGRTGGTDIYYEAHDDGEPRVIVGEAANNVSDYAEHTFAGFYGLAEGMHEKPLGSRMVAFSWGDVFLFLRAMDSPGQCLIS